MFDRFLIIRWLLQNSDVFKRVIGIAVDWPDATSLSERLKILSAIILELAPIVDTLPVFAAQCVAMSEEDKEKDLVECQAMGIPPGLLTIILPLIMEVLRILTKRDD